MSEPSNPVRLQAIDWAIAFLTFSFVVVGMVHTMPTLPGLDQWAREFTGNPLLAIRRFPFEYLNPFVFALMMTIVVFKHSFYRAFKDRGSLTAGFSLAAAADITIAADHAKFTMAYTNAGLSPDGSSTYFLPRRIGDRKARELMLTNRVLSAAEAADWGIIHQGVPADEVESTVDALAKQLANGPTLAFGSVKTLLNQSFDNGLETQMELETREIARLSATADGQEGIQAFLTKRRPAFTGKN